MHHIYHTEALILGSKNYGDSGKVFFLFTRELGMVYASATGIRKIHSKLRYVLQDYSYVKVDLVRGKDMWRLTTASKPENDLNFLQNYRALEVFANIARLLRRLLAGEDTNKTMFDDLLSSLFVLAGTKTKEELADVEVVMVLRMLNHLGYIGNSDDMHNLILSPFSEEVVFEISKKRAKVLHAINKAIRETQM